MAAAPTEPLRLRVEDADDVKVVSAALQDAIAKVGDISYEPAARRLTIALNRFRWESPQLADGGQLLLSFAGGADLKVEVECLDAVLADLSTPWPTPRAPRHDVD